MDKKSDFLPNALERFMRAADTSPPRTLAPVGNFFSLIFSPHPWIAIYST